MNNLDPKTAKRVAESLLEHTWDTRVSDCITSDDVDEILDQLSTPDGTNWAVQAAQGWLSNWEDRYPHDHNIWSESFQSLMPPEVYAELEDSLAQSKPIDESLLKELMEIELVSIILRRLVEKILEAFVEGVINRDGPKVPSVGRSAFGLATRASRGLFDKVSSQIEGPLRDTMKGFIQGSMDRLKAQLADILRSPELK